jgi:1-acyl-sn-glycerol-3-phosphate acyltransferase
MLKAAIMNEHPTRKDARFLVEDFVFHMPILGSFMYRIGGVRACPENAQRLLEQDHLVIVFPEGVKGIGKYYNQRYKLQRFGRGGFIKLCINTKSPLVPVGIVGAEEIHPIVYKSNVLAKTIGVPYLPLTPTFPLLGLLGMIPLPSKWSIHFGEPILFDDYAPSVLDDELTIHHLSERVRSEIQKIILEQLRKRRSVWFG